MATNDDPWRLFAVNILEIVFEPSKLGAVGSKWAGVLGTFATR